MTISREMGAGGTQTGQLVADKLGFDYYDREIIDQMRRATGVSVEHIAALGDRAA